MEIILLLIRLLLAVIFALAGIGKILDLEGAEKAVKDFGVPQNLAKSVSVALPIAEIVIALLLLFSSTAWFGAVSGFLLLLVFIGGMLWQLAQGNAPDCHCFGQIYSEPVSAKSLIRNAVFAILSFFLVIRGTDGQGASLLDSSINSTEGNLMSLILGFATVGLLAAAVYFLKIISDQQTQIMRRIEVLELTSFEGGETKREDVSQPTNGLLIGTRAPDFVLPDINGKKVSLKQILAASKPILVFFLSPNCGPCEALMPEIESWQNELKGKINFVFISNGKVKENLTKFGGTSLKQILIQKEKEVMGMFGAQWTPTVLAISSEGFIASRQAVGDKAIRQLIQNTKDAFVPDEILIVSPPTGEGEAETLLGENLPEFTLPDLSNKTVSSNDLLGKKTLITYWSITCGYCNQMLDDLRAWDKNKGADEPELLLLSRGEVESHKNLQLDSTVLLENEQDVSSRFGMQGTPSAVLINEDGRVISEIAVGADQIWELLGKTSKSTE